MIVIGARDRIEGRLCRVGARDTVSVRVKDSPGVSLMLGLRIALE